METLAKPSVSRILVLCSNNANDQYYYFTWLYHSKISAYTFWGKAMIKNESKYCSNNFFGSTLNHSRLKLQVIIVIIKVKKIIIIHNNKVIIIIIIK